MLATSGVTPSGSSATLHLHLPPSLPPPEAGTRCSPDPLSEPHQAHPGPELPHSPPTPGPPSWSPGSTLQGSAGPAKPDSWEPGTSLVTPTHPDNLQCAGSSPHRPVTSRSSKAPMGPVLGGCHSPRPHAGTELWLRLKQSHSVCGHWGQEAPPGALELSRAMRARAGWCDQQADSCWRDGRHRAARPAASWRPSLHASRLPGRPRPLRAVWGGGEPRGKPARMRVWACGVACGAQLHETLLGTRHP